MTGSLNLAAQASQTLRFAAGLARFLRTPLTASASHDLIARNLAARPSQLPVPRRARASTSGRIAPTCDCSPTPGSSRATCVRWWPRRGSKVRWSGSTTPGSMSAWTSSRDVSRSGAAAWRSTPARTISTTRWQPITSRADPEARAAPARGSGSTSPTTRRMPPTSIVCWKRIGLFGRPYVLWRPAPPWTAGLKGALSHMKLGHSVARWFAQQPLTWRGPGWHHALIARYRRCHQPCRGPAAAFARARPAGRSLAGRRLAGGAGGGRPAGVAQHQSRIRRAGLPCRGRARVSTLQARSFASTASR